MIQSSCSTESY